MNWLVQKLMKQKTSLVTYRIVTGKKRSKWNKRHSCVYLFLIITFSNVVMKNVESYTGTSFDLQSQTLFRAIWRHVETMHFPLLHFI